MSSFTDALITRRLADGINWNVERQFDFHIGELNSNVFARVHKGFTTNLASIPRLARLFVPKTGKHDQAATLHDQGYEYRVIFVRHPNGKVSYVVKDRAYWDRVFYDALLVLGVRRTRAWLMYQAVRMGGWIAWNKSVKADKEHPYIGTLKAAELLT